jgi:hypothetical protein
MQNADDLKKTTRRLVTSIAMRDTTIETLTMKYTAYQSEQPIANFHGLRDYYALIKGLSGIPKLDPLLVKRVLARNFAGSEVKPEDIYKSFFPRQADNSKTKSNINIDNDFPSALDSIKANLEDPNARHLLVIGNSDLTIDVLETCLSEVKDKTGGARKTPRIIYGSQFTSDQGPEYAYTVLNTILLCVEEGRPVILKDLQIIYGMILLFLLAEFHLSS